MPECIPDTRYISSPDFIVTALHILTSFEVPVMLFGGYCILFKTPTTMASVKWLMLNLHFWTTLSDLMLCFIGIPYILLPAPAGYSLGLVYAPHVMIYLLITFLAAVAASVLAIYENRYFVLIGHKTCWKRLRNPILFLIYTFVPLIFVPPVVTVPDQETARPLVLSTLPCLPEFTYSDRPLFVLSLDYKLPFFCLIAGTTVFAVSISTFAILMYLHVIIGGIRKNTSVKTFMLNKKFAIGLTIQSAFLLSLLVAPVLSLIFVIHYWHHDQALNNIIFITVSFHGVGSTIVMVLVHRPYRVFTWSLVQTLLPAKMKHSHQDSRPRSIRHINIIV